MKYNTAIFDFDYTLADSSEGIIQCINYALQELKLPQHTPDNIRATIGMTLPKTFEVLTGNNDDETTIEFRQLFKTKADEVINKNTIVFDYVGDTIRRLRDSDVKTAIVSTKFRYRIAEILDRDNILDLFDLIVGGEDVSEHKPDPEGLNLAISELKAEKEQTIYIGDSVIDAITAQDAGVDFIAVLSGVTPQESFNEYSSLAILENLEYLPDFILNHLE